ncbi:MAG: arsenate reductase (glutaredoxin) [Myxococcota bacterium]|nr:arsenate reductase (glutaredoxin) [Myxococcota bacterium]
MALTNSPEAITLFHNPRCSKSRATKVLLEERGVAFEVREYLQDPLSSEELREMEECLGRPISEWVRTGEDAYAQAGLSEAAGSAELIQLVVEHPICMERPIVVKGDAAAVGRPPEAVLSILS